MKPSGRCPAERCSAATRGLGTVRAEVDPVPFEQDTSPDELAKLGPVEARRRPAARSAPASQRGDDRMVSQGVGQAAASPHPDRW